MGKIYGIENRPKSVLKSASCDRCDNDCKNMHFDIKTLFSFSENEEIIETICYSCFKKLYQKRMTENKEKNLQRAIKAYDEEKSLKKG